MFCPTFGAGKAEEIANNRQGLAKTFIRWMLENDKNLIISLLLEKWGLEWMKTGVGIQACWGAGNYHPIIASIDASIAFEWPRGNTGPILTQTMLN